MKAHVQKTGKKELGLPVFCWLIILLSWKILDKDVKGSEEGDALLCM